eukprot:gene7788-9137_t
MDPPVLETYTLYSSLYNQVTNGTYYVTFTSPGGCQETRNYTFLLPKMVITEPPKCQFSIGKATFAAPSLFFNYTFDGDSTIHNALPFNVTAGYTQVNAKYVTSTSICAVYEQVRPLSSTTPSITTTQVQCDGTNGTVTVGNAASYTSMSLYVVSTKETLEAVNGVFSNIPASEYSLTLVSQACGIEVIDGVIVLEKPFISFQVLPGSGSCIDESVSVAVSIPGMPNAKFSIDDGAFVSSPFSLHPGQQYSVAYQNGDKQVCTDYRYFNVPFTVADVTHTLAQKPTCQSPNSEVTISSSRLSQILYNDVPVPASGKFPVVYGTRYSLYDNCTHTGYNFRFDRTLPIYNVEPNEQTCATLWTITVLNINEFEYVTLIDGNNATNAFNSSSGVFNVIPAGYILKSLEKNCDASFGALSPLTSSVVPPTVPEFDPTYISYEPTIVTPCVCNNTGVMNLKALYKDTVVYELHHVEFLGQTAITMSFGTCGDYQYSVPRQLTNLPKVSVTIISQPSCEYAYDGVLEITTTGINTITTVSINDGYFEKSPDNRYPVGTGLVNIIVPFKINLKKTPQLVKDCSVVSGTVQVLNTETFTKLEVDYSAAEGNIWTLGGSYHTLEFSTEGCTGTYQFDIPTEDITITTTQQTVGTCGGDTTYLLTARNATHTYQSIRVDMDGEVSFSEENRVFYGVIPGQEVQTTLISDFCAWPYSFTPAELRSLDSIISLEVLQYPSCPDAADGILQIVNHYDLPMAFRRVNGNTRAIQGDKIYNWPIFQEAGPKYVDQYDLYWNEGCSNQYYLQVDLTKVSYRPKYTVVPANCGSANAKVIFSQADLALYEINVDSIYTPNAQGEIILPITGMTYYIYYYNRVTKCATSERLRPVYGSTPMSNLASVSVQNETCPGTADGIVHVPSSSAATRNQLSTSADLYTGLTSNIYLLTHFNPSTPFCYEAEILTIGALDAVASIVAPDICVDGQTSTLVASVSGPFTNVTYTLDGVTSQLNNGQFTGLSTGNHTLRNIITMEVDNSVCNTLKVTSSNSDPTSVLVASIDGSAPQTSPIVSGVATFTGLPASITYTVTVQDSTGCSVVKQITTASCQLSSSTTTKSSIILATIKTTYVEGVMVLYADVGNYSVTFTSPNGCTQTEIYTFAFSKIVVSSQPKCQHSLVDATFAAPSLFANFTLNGDSQVYSELPFKLSSGYRMITAFRATDGGICNLGVQVEPLTNKVPSITVTNLQCDGTNGSVTVNNAASYSSIKIHIQETNETYSAANGIFSQLPLSPYTLTLVSAECGTEVIKGATILQSPYIQVQVVPSTGPCIDEQVQVIASVSGHPNAKFSLNGGEYLAPPFLVTSAQAYYISFREDGKSQCPGSQYFRVPPTAADVSHSIKKQPTCQSPNGEWQSSNSDPAPIVNGLISVVYGEGYEIFDNCSKTTYGFTLSRTSPIVSVSTTSPTCVGLWNITVTNAHEFEYMMLVDRNNETNTINSTSGVFTNLSSTNWHLRTLEKSLPEEELDFDKVIFVETIITPNICNYTGSVNLKAYYSGMLVGETTSNYTIGSPVLIGIGRCGSFNHLLNQSLVTPPPLAYKIITQPSCDYATDGVVEITNNGLNGITYVLINGNQINKTPDNRYTGITVGNNDIQVVLLGCNFGAIKSTLNVASTNNNFKLNLKITPQKIADCEVESGSIQVLNSETFTDISLNHNRPGENNKWIVGGSEDYTLRFTTETCSGQYSITVPTESITMTTTLMPGATCGIATNYLLKATNGTYDYPLQNGIITNDTLYYTDGVIYDNDGESTMSTVPYEVVLTHVFCRWSQTFTPSPQRQLKDLFSIRVVQFPSCIDAADGVLQIVNNFNIPAFFKKVSGPGSDMLVGDKILNWYLSQDDWMNPNFVQYFSVTWNVGCEFTYQVAVDTAKQFTTYDPPYTYVAPDCGSSTSKIIFDQATLAKFDINVNNKFKPNDQGEISLLVSSDDYSIYSYNRVTKCAHMTYILPWFNTGVANIGNIVIQNETCPNSYDGFIRVPQSTATSHNHLSVRGSYGNSLISPDINYSPISADSTFAGLNSGEYILTRTNPSNPYCFENQRVYIGSIEPVLSIVAPDICTDGQSSTLVASVSGPFTNVTYTLDGKISQLNNGQFTGLSTGQHTIQVEINQATCLHTLPLSTFTVKQNLIALEVDNSLCNSLKVTSSNNDPTSTLVATITDGTNPQTSPIVSGVANFNSLTSGSTYTVTVQDSTGCSVAKQVTIATCDLSSSTTTKSSIIIVIVSIIIAMLF